MTFATMTTRAVGYIIKKVDDWDVIIANFLHLNTSFHIPLFPNSSGVAPSSLLNAAAYMQVQSGAAGTPKPEFPVLAFDGAGTVNEGRMWTGRVPRGYGSTLTINGMFYCSGTAGSAVMQVQIACVTPSDAAGTAKAYAAVNTGTVAIPAVAYTWQPFSLTIANADSIAGGDWFNAVVSRVPNDAGDTQTADINVTSIDAYFSLQ